MADAVSAEIERDPDRYAPETWSINPVGHCPCCDEDVYRCTTRHTGWSEGFSTHANVVHPRCDEITSLPDPNGTEVGCCCVAPNWGPMHSKKARTPKKPTARKKKPAARKRCGVEGCRLEPDHDGLHAFGNNVK